MKRYALCTFGLLALLWLLLASALYAQTPPGHQDPAGSARLSTAPQTSSAATLATQVVLQNGLNGYLGCSDTRISAEAPTTNFASSELKAGSLQRLASLIQFDLSTIPATATVESASLAVYGSAREGSPFTLGVYRVWRPWSETQATWQLASTALPWAAAGCNNTVSDRAETASSESSPRAGSPGRCAPTCKPWSAQPRQTAAG